MALKDLSVKIGADTSGFSEGIKAVQNGMQQTSATAAAVAKSVTASTNAMKIGMNAAVEAVSQQKQAVTALSTGMTGLTAVSNKGAQAVSQGYTATTRALQAANSTAAATNKSLSSQAASLAAEYRKQGMSQSDSFKAAWAKIEKTSNSGSTEVKNNITGIGKKAKNVSENMASDFNKSSKSINSGLKSMSSGFSALAKSALALVGVTTIIASVTAAVTQSFKSFVNLESSVNRVNSLFGESAKYIKYFAENTGKAFGMAESSAYQYAATYGNLFKNITRDGDENAKVTIAMLKASAVIASKTGGTVDDAMERIRSGLLGNTEAIEDLGINVNVAMLETTDAFKKIADGRSWEQLTFYEQQQIRTLAILEQAQNSFGDKVQKGSAYSLSVLSGAFENLKSTAGAFVEKALMPIVAWLTKTVQLATLGLKTLAAFMGIKIGDDDKSNDKDKEAAKKTGETKKNLEGAAKSTKEIKKNLMGFDELNVLSSNTADSAASAADGASVWDGLPEPEYDDSAPELDTSKLEEAFAKIKKGFSDTISFIKSKFEPAISALKNLWSAVAGPAITAFNNIKTAIKDLWDNTLKPFLDYITLDWIPSIANGFTTTFAPIFADIIPVLLSEFALDFSFICTQISNFVNDILKPSFEGIKTAALDIFAGIKKAWDEHGAGILDGFIKFKESLREIWTNIYENIIKPVVTNIGSTLSWLWDKHLKPLWDKIAEFFGALTEFALAYWNNVLAPKINWLVETFGPAFTRVFKTMVDVVGTVVGAIADAVGGIIESLSGILDFLTGVFTGDWDKALEGIKQSFKGTFDSFAGIAKGAVNLVIDMFNGMISNVWSGFSDFIDGAGSIVEKMGEALGKDWVLSISGDAPQIPKLASGGVVNGPTIAMIGEAGKEAVMPLENNTGWINELASRISLIMQGNQPAYAGGDTVIPVYIGNDLIDEFVVKASAKNQYRTNGG
jgi:phage-related protein